MKRVSLACVAMLALAATATAADLPRRYDPVPAPRAPAFIPVYNWTGLLYRHQRRRRLRHLALGFDRQL